MKKVAKRGLSAEVPLRQVTMDYDGLWRIMTDYDGLWRIMTDFDRLWRILTDYDGLWRIITYNDGFWRGREGISIVAKVSIWLTENVGQCLIAILMLNHASIGDTGIPVSLW